MRISLTTLCVSLMSVCSLAKMDSLPRYRLSVGQELTYVSSSVFKYEHGTLNSGSTDIYDVVAKNPDGGWHIIGRLAEWETQDSSTPPASPDVELIAFDLHPDGSAALSPGVSYRGGVPTNFPALPADQAQWKDSWSRAQPYGARMTYKAAPSTRPGMIEFTAERVDPIDRIYLMTSQATYQFDPARGLVVSSVSQNSQGYGFVGKGTGANKLTNDADQTREWMDKFAKDCAAYFAANARVSDLESKASDIPDQCDAYFAMAKEILTVTQRQVTTPEVSAVVAKQLAELDGDAHYTKQDNQNRQALLGKPAPTWMLTDLSGANHSLDEYRGKVVVLDFWYRGCGWCMRAMPEMRKLSESFATKPVAVLGMNTDNDPADPKFVATTFGLEYPILHVGRDVVQQYHVQGFPTVFVIGPDGTIKNIEVGYSDKLGDKLAAKVAELLPAR